MITDKKTVLSNIVLYSLSLGMIVYVALRAYYLSFTHDESLSYTILIGIPHWVNDANNHLLNTFLMRIFYHIFGSSEFVLRLPNVIAFVFFIWGTLHILKQQHNIWVSMTGIVLIFLNPFVLDFFSLARGYGLSLGMMMVSFAFLIDNFSYKTNYRFFIKSFIFVFTFGALSFLANLGSINYFIVILGIYPVLGFRNYRKGMFTTVKKKITFFLVLTGALLFFYWGVTRLLLMQEEHQLYVGSSSFFRMLFTLITGSFYLKHFPYWLFPLVKYLLIFFMITGVFLIASKKDFFGKLSLIVAVNVLMTLGLVLEHVLFKTHYPPGRTALYFLPLFGLLVCCVISELFIRFESARPAWIIISLLIILPLAWHFLTSMNLKYTKQWYYDAHTKDVMKIIHHETDGLSKPASVSNNWLFEPSINYYRSSRGIKIDSANREGVKFSTVFIYEFNKKTLPPGYKVLANYKDIGTILLMRADSVQNKVSQ